MNTFQKKIKDRRITIFFLRFGIISLRVEMEVVEMSMKKEWVFRNGIYWLCSTVSGSSFFSSIWKECELVIKHFFSLPWRNTRLHAAPFWKLPWNLFFSSKWFSLIFWPSWIDEFFSDFRHGNVITNSLFDWNYSRGSPNYYDILDFTNSFQWFQYSNFYANWLQTSHRP